MASDPGAQRALAMMRAQSEELQRLTLALRTVYEATKTTTSSATEEETLRYIRGVAAAALRISIADGGTDG